MVATLARLRLRLLRNALARERWRIVLLVLGALYGLGLAVTAVGGLTALGFSEPVVRDTVLVLAGTLLVLGWTLVPLLAYGIDNTLDPQRFALYLAPSPRFTLGLFLAGAVGVPGIVTVLVCLGSALVWLGQGSAGMRLGVAGYGVVTGLLAAALCLLLARVTTTAAAGFLRGRRGRDLAGIAGVVVVLAVSLLPMLLSSGGQGLSLETFRGLAGVVGWTPFGAVWGSAAALSAGDGTGALARLGITLATLALLAWAYHALVGRSMTRVAGEAASGGRRRGRLPFAQTLLRWQPEGAPTNRWRISIPTAAVAGRCLRYWRADPRYVSSVVSIALMPFLVMAVAFFSTTQDGLAPRTVLGWAVLLLAPVVAWLGAWSLHNDIAYDSTAFWLHLSTGLRGTEDRMGRVLALTVWLLPATIVLAVVPPALVGRGSFIPAVLGVSLAVLGAGLGSSSVFSALTPYPAPPPGANPLSNQSTGVGLAMVVQLGAMVVSLLLTLPTALTLIPVFAHSPLWGWLTLVVGGATAVVCLVIGVRRGGAAVERRGVDVLARIKAWPKH